MYEPKSDHAVESVIPRPFFYGTPANAHGSGSGTATVTTSTPAQTGYANGRLGCLYGTSDAMRKVFQQIEQVAPSDMSVLIVGESGCGKELAAQQIHNMSLRSAGPFVPLNCGALPPSLIEAELFGYEKGAFTGASRSHQGFFERAAGGTLFLDEITEMPLEMQVRLLRVLESGRLVRVGGTREVACQVRVLAATNRDPLEAVRANQLREDLLYRLAVFPLTLPPLRERGTDVLLLAKHFLAELNRQYGTAKRLSDRAAETLCQHDWPGNVRELKNCIQRAYVLTTDSEALDIDTVIPLGRCERLPGQGRLEFKVGVSLADAEQQIIFATLDHYEGNKRKAAEVLGVSLKTLYNRLNEYHRAGTLPERFAIGTGTRLG